MNTNIEKSSRTDRFALGKSVRQAIYSELADSGFNAGSGNRARTQRSKRDKQDDPRRQRREYREYRNGGYCE
jgi:hypothetical protein